MCVRVSVCPCAAGPPCRSYIEYYNHYAFSYVGIYGWSFGQSGQAVSQLFRHRGWHAIVNDSLISRVLQLGCSAVGLGTALVGALVAGVHGAEWSAVLQTDAVPVVTVAGAVVGFAVCWVCMSAIESAVTTVFLCLAEDPAVLGQTHPTEHANLMAAWVSAHPVAMQQCGYAQ